MDSQTFLPFSIGDRILVIAKITDLFKNFSGYVVELKDNNIISVRDQDDDVYDVEITQCSKLGV